MERAGAAEGEQREVARVDAALDGHHPQRPDHLRVRDAADPLGALAQPEPELLAEPADRVACRARVELDRARQRRAGAEQAEDDVGVGHGRRLAAVTVGRRPRARAGRARADPQRAARVAPGDRAAAGADGVEVEHRQRDRAAADRPAAGLAGAAVLDHADVARRAAHVEAERVGLVRGERGPGRAGGAAGRARQHGQRGVRAGLVERGQAARGLHDVGRRQVRVGGALGQRAQVGGQQGGEGGVDLGRRRALVLAERADDLVAERDVHAGELLGQRRAERLLVLRVAVGVEQADGHRLGIQPRDLARERRGVRERRRGPVGRHPLRRADAPVRAARAAPGAPRTAGRGRRAPGGRARRRPRSRGWRRAPCARRCPRAARWSPRSCRARTPRPPRRPRRPSPAPPRRRRARPPTGPPASSAPSP